MNNHWYFFYRTIFHHLKNFTMLLWVDELSSSFLWKFLGNLLIHAMKKQEVFWQSFLTTFLSAFLTAFGDFLTTFCRLFTAFRWLCFVLFFMQWQLFTAFRRLCFVLFLMQYKVRFAQYKSLITFFRGGV